MPVGLAAYIRGDDVPVTIPRDAAREAAERELSKPIYHENDPNLVQRALDWLWTQMSELLAAASGATPGGWVGLITIAAVIVLAAVALRLRLGRLRRTPDTRRPLYGTRPRSAAEHRAAAELHAERMEWAEAVQERLRALVRGLEERALLDPRPGRTADEAAAEAGRSLPRHTARLHSCARSFDDIRYGGRTATEAAYRSIRDLDTELERAKPQHAPVPSHGGGPT